MTSIEEQINCLKALWITADQEMRVSLQDTINLLLALENNNGMKNKNNVIFIFDQERDSELIKKIYKIN